MQKQVVMWIGRGLMESRVNAILTTVFLALSVILLYIDQESRTTFFSFITSTTTLLLFLFAGLSSIAIVSLSLYLLGRWLFSIGDNIPHNIVVIPLPVPDSVWKNKNTHMSFASVKVTNQESNSISNLYAVMKKEKQYGTPSTIFDQSQGNHKITWKVPQGQNNTNVSIGARNGEAILHVYAFSASSGIWQKGAANSFCYCGEPASFRLQPNPGLYEIEIEFYGEFNNGDEVRLKPFVGYVFSSYSENGTNVEFNLRIDTGVPPKDLNFKEILI